MNHENSWNWLVILMLATVWQILKLKGEQSPETEMLKVDFEKWNLNKQAWIIVTTKRLIKKGNNFKTLYFIYESWYIIYFIDRCEVAWHNLLDCCGKTWLKKQSSKYKRERHKGSFTNYVYKKKWVGGPEMSTFISYKLSTKEVGSQKSQKLVNEVCERTPN